MVAVFSHWIGAHSPVNGPETANKTTCSPQATQASKWFGVLLNGRPLMFEDPDEAGVQVQAAGVREKTSGSGRHLKKSTSSLPSSALSQQVMRNLRGAKSGSIAGAAATSAQGVTGTATCTHGRCFKAFL